MSSRIVVFGATGSTGRLVAERLAARGARPVLAGRDEARLAALAERSATALRSRPERALRTHELQRLFEESDTSLRMRVGAGL